MLMPVFVVLRLPKFNVVDVNGLHIVFLGCVWIFQLCAHLKAFLSATIETFQFTEEQVSIFRL